MNPVVFIGNDPRELTARRVCEASLRKQAMGPVDVRQVDLALLQQAGFYTRPTEQRNGCLVDVISGVPMSTTHALARFLVPWLETAGWALFTDCDVLWRAPVQDLFAAADARWAVMVVKQPLTMGLNPGKMDGQAQTHYSRKWWSSVCLWNTRHPAHDRLTLEAINTRPGLWLHQFGWLEDEEIGELGPWWNHLVGVNPHAPEAKLVHFTLGTPDMPGYASQPFADEWRSYLSEGR